MKPPTPYLHAFSRFYDQDTEQHTPDFERDMDGEALWQQAHRENEEIDRYRSFGSSSVVSQQRPLRRLERFFIFPIVFAARVTAGCIMVILWLFPVGPIWFAILLRTIAAYAIANVIALFNGSPHPSRERLDYVSELWPAGFGRIADICFRYDPKPSQPIPISTREAIRETILAILFYGGSASMYLVVHILFRLLSWMFTIAV